MKIELDKAEVSFEQFLGIWNEVSSSISVTDRNMLIGPVRDHFKSEIEKFDYKP